MDVEPASTGWQKLRQHTHLLSGQVFKLGGRHLGISLLDIAELCNGSTYDSDSQNKESQRKARYKAT